MDQGNLSMSPEILQSLIHQETNTGTLVSYKDDIISWYNPWPVKKAFLKDHIGREYNKKLHHYGLDSYIEPPYGLTKVDAGLRPLTDESFLA